MSVGMVDGLTLQERMGLRETDRLALAVRWTIFRLEMLLTIGYKVCLPRLPSILLLKLSVKIDKLLIPTSCHPPFLHTFVLY
jgi:hypothetical protein